MNTQILFFPGILTVLAAAMMSRPDTTAATRGISAGEPRDRIALGSNSQDMAKARALYQKHCADCHGPTGRGDGKAAVDLDPAPPDLSSPEVARESDQALFAKITRGRKPMPGFAKETTEEQRWLLVSYVRTFSRKAGEGAGK